MKVYNGLTDSDKVFVTVAFWVVSSLLILVGLTLPMLPEKITIFYQPEQGSEYYSKFANLLLCLPAILSCGVIIVCASLKNRGKLRNNFISVLLCIIMINICICGVSLYGISRQFVSTDGYNSINAFSITALLISFVLSLLCAFTPMILNSPTYKARKRRRGIRKVFILDSMQRNWRVGAYGYILCGIVSAFMAFVFVLIPVAVFSAAYGIFILVTSDINRKRSMVSAKARSESGADSTGASQSSDDKSAEHPDAD